MDAVVAIYSDWGIGCGGTQPVTLKADRKHFRELTAGKTVIVGRKTLADFPGGMPLKGRRNIVLTRQDLYIPGAEIAHSPEEAAALHPNAVVIGGASVYRELMPYIGRVYITKLEAAPLSDSFFPNLDDDPAWTCSDTGERLEEDGIGYRFLTYERVL